MCDEQAMTAEEWLYELQRPNAKLTPMRVLMLDVLLRMRRKTIREWASILSPKRLPNGEMGDSDPLTQDEAALLGAISTYDQGVLTSGGVQHLEGMVGTLDEFLHASNPLYRQLADKRAKPAPMLPEREAS
jgi:hypothetical protein